MVTGIKKKHETMSSEKMYANTVRAICLASNDKNRLVRLVTVITVISMVNSQVGRDIINEGHSFQNDAASLEQFDDQSRWFIKF